MEITSLPGFDRSLYDSLRTEYVNRTDGAAEGLNQALKTLTDANVPFADAVGQLKGGLPALPEPAKDASVPGAFASFGANVLALITDTANKERTQARESRIQREAEIITSMEQEAKEIEKKAMTQLIVGCIAGGVSILSGAVSVGMTIHGSSAAQSAAEKASSQARTNKMTELGLQGENGGFKLGAKNKMAEVAAHSADVFQNTLNSEMGRVNSNIQTAQTFFHSVNQFADAAGKFFESNADAEARRVQAQTEKIRQSAEMIKDLEQSLSALIQKAQSTMDAIQANINQTRTRILG